MKVNQSTETTEQSINFDDAKESQDLIRNIQQPTVGTRSQPVPAHLDTLFQSSITDRDEIETDRHNQGDTLKVLQHLLER